MAETMPRRIYPRNETRYRKVRIADHPLAQADGQVYVHRAVLYGRIGAGVHACHWCGRDVEWHAQGIRRLVADQLDADRLNNVPENLVPSCRVCNSGRNRRADFLTHCESGHAWTAENTYERPDGKGRQCRACNERREVLRSQEPEHKQKARERARRHYARKKAMP